VISVGKCFSVLVASGNGQRCNDLRTELRNTLYEVDEQTDKYNLVIWKFGNKSNPKAFERVSKKVAKAISPFFSDIDDMYFSVDYKRKEV
jgi:hypothetical protein